MIEKLSSSQESLPLKLVMAPEAAETDDEDFLDEFFDRAVTSLGEGTAVEVETASIARPYLRSRIEDCVRMAREIAVRPSPVPNRLAGFELIRELGRGSGGVVYLARQNSAWNRLIALKVLRDSTLSSFASRERFLREARALTRVRHDNVVAVHDVIDADGVSAIAMDWVDGRSLSEVLRERHWPRSADSTATSDRLRLAATVGISIGRALGAVHRGGLVHRDVKPSNIMVRDDGRILLTDFGLARGAEDSRLTLTGQAVGTPAYSAPEQLRGDQRCFGPTSDVYSLGATLFEVACGRLAVEGDSVIEILRRLDSGNVPSLRAIDPTIPRDLETIVATAMDPDPSLRYATADTLADELERMLSFRPILARRPSVWRRTMLIARRHRGALTGAMVVLVLAGLLAGIMAVKQWRRMRADAEVVDARQLLLNRAFGEHALFERVSGRPSDESKSVDGELIDRLRLAVDRLDAALDLGPSDRSSISRLRAVAAAGLALLLDRGAGEEAGRLLERLSAATAHMAREWWPVERRRAAVDDIDPRIDPDEWLMLGLLALVCGDVGLCEDALSRVDSLDRRDPFIEVALGLAEHARDHAERAYPRLLRGCEAFQESGFVFVAAADCALRCGDLVRARDLLERSRSFPLQDLFDIHLRIEADLLVLDGEVDAARAKYYAFVHRRSDSRARASLALLLARRGEFGEAAGWLAEAIRNRPTEATYRILLAKIGNAWWRSAPRSARINAIYELLFRRIDGGRRPGLVLRKLMDCEPYLRRAPDEPFWTPFGTIYGETPPGMASSRSTETLYPNEFRR